MEKGLEGLWDAVENRRLAMIERVRSLPVDKQTARPSPKEFSPVEVLMHMALTEVYDVELIAKNPPATLAARKAKPSFIFPRVLKTLSSAKKVPTIGSMIPASDISLEEAERKWAEVRQQMRDYLEPLPNADAPTMKHPLFGLCSAGDLIALLNAHTQYHEVRFPGA